MKADLINTKYGIAIQITALSTDDKIKLAAFMQQRKNAHKPRLKILHSPDHSEILNIGFVLPITKKYLLRTENEVINYRDYYREAFPEKLTAIDIYSTIWRANGLHLVINSFRDGEEGFLFAAIANDKNMTLTFKGLIYSVADIEKLKREL